MKIPDITELNSAFALQQGKQHLNFKTGQSDIPLIEIHNEQATAVISLQGAHLLSWVPTGSDEVIWLSEDAKFESAKSVRGGIPICWPWFGAHESNAAYPAHGFARTVLWQVTNTQALSSGETQITFKLESHQLDESSQKMWPLATVAEYRVTIGKAVTLELTTSNHSEELITVSQALHTYFKVDDVSLTQVHGLEDRDYLDKTDSFQRKTQFGPVSINSEVDRVYLQTPDDVSINDQQRTIIIKKQGSRSTVVWNPWQAVAEKMGDLGKDGYLRMLCVESANAAEDSVRINPGESHTLRVTYALG